MALLLWWIVCCFSAFFCATLAIWRGSLFLKVPTAEGYLPTVVLTKFWPKSARLELLHNHIIIPTVLAWNTGPWIGTILTVKDQNPHQWQNAVSVQCGWFVFMQISRPRCEEAVYSMPLLTPQRAITPKLMFPLSLSKPWLNFKKKKTWPYF